MALEKDHDAIQMAQGKAASVSEDFLAGVLGEREARVDANIYRILAAGEPLSPEVAVQAWCERYSYHTLRIKLAQLVRRGSQASARLHPDE